MENFDQTSLDDIFTGTRGSECFNPCLSTQTKVSIVEDRIASNDNSTTWIGLNFDQTVDITEYFYPEFSISDFLSSLGGALGLWLGVGVAQIGGYARLFVEKIRRFTKFF